MPADCCIPPAFPYTLLKCLHTDAPPHQQQTCPNNASCITQNKAAHASTICVYALPTVLKQVGLSVPRSCLVLIVHMPAQHPVFVHMPAQAWATRPQCFSHPSPFLKKHTNNNTTLLLPRTCMFRQRMIRQSLWPPLLPYKSRK